MFHAVEEPKDVPARARRKRMHLRIFASINGWFMPLNRVRRDGGVVSTATEHHEAYQRAIFSYLWMPCASKFKRAYLDGSLGSLITCQSK